MTRSSDSESAARKGPSLVFRLALALGLLGSLLWAGYTWYEISQGRTDFLSSTDRILEDTDGVCWLNCNIRFRSNDAWGASFMNMFGFIQFNKEIMAAGIAEKIGKPVRLGRLNWQADSYHIYGKDIQKAKM